MDTISALGFLSLALCALVFRLVGLMSVGEVIVIFSFFYFFKNLKRVLQISLLKKLTLVFFIYFVSLVLTDYFRNVTFDFYSREWAKQGVFLMSLVFFSFIFFFRQSHIKYLILGYYLFRFSTLFFKSSQAEGFCDAGDEYECVRWYWMAPLSLLMVLIFDKVRKKYFFLGVLLIVGLISLLLLVGNRSGSLINFLSLYVLLFTYFFPPKNKTFLRIFKMVIGLVFFGLCFKGIYSVLASSGALGEKNQQKYFLQSKGGGFDFKKGRQESGYYLSKIIESPIVGYGSGYADLMYVLNKRVELEIEGMPKHELVPVHSVAAAAWLYGGVFGGVFWLLVCWIFIRNLFWVYYQKESDFFLFISLTVGGIWGMFFSPFGLSAKVIFPFIISWNLHVSYCLGLDKIFQIFPKNKKNHT